MDSFTWPAAATAVLVGSLGYMAISTARTILGTLPLLRIPGPKGSSMLLGLMREIRDSPPCAMHIKWAAQYAGIFSYRIFALKTRVCVTDANAIKRIMVTHTHLYSKPVSEIRLLRRLAGKGLFTSEGEDYQRQKRILSKAFHFESLKSIFPLFVGRAQELLMRWDGMVKSAEGKGVVVDVNESMNLLTLDIIGTAGFGYDFQGVAGGDSVVRHCVEAFFSGAGLNLTHMILTTFPLLEKLLPNSARQEAERRFEKCVLDVIEKKRGSGGWGGLGGGHGGWGGKDLLDVMLEAQEGLGAGAAMSTQELVDNVKTFLFAGHETTSNTLAWALLLLAQHPAAREKLREEIRGVCGGGHIEYQHLEQLPYLQAVVKETMRLYPAAPLTFRDAVEDDELCGWRIPKGTSICISAMVLQRDASLWDEPDVFRPERFMKATEDTKSNHPYRWFPFLAGPRMCIGYKFSLNESAAVLASVIQKYDLDLEESHVEVVPKLRITMRPSPSLKMRLTPIKAA